jgi:hypothetical protein
MCCGLVSRFFLQKGHSATFVQQSMQILCLFLQQGIGTKNAGILLIGFISVKGSMQMEHSGISCVRVVDRALFSSALVGTVSLPPPKQVHENAKRDST